MVRSRSGAGPGVRVLGGLARGRRLRVPPVAGTRPTSSRVREAIFDVLEARGLVEGARVLDAFAGSGALGIEALSRGASAVTFVELDPRAASVIEANLEAVLPALGADAPEGRRARATVVRADVLAWLSRHPPTFDLALVDPPYSFERWRELLELLPCSVAVLESARPIPLPQRLTQCRTYRHGATLVTLVAARGFERLAPTKDRP